ncbi:Transcriptional regulator of nonfermentable carbon utilization [Dissophora globulifera]|nr:Transcriptional regulator of nonfermentable carbon utilization [Dissophora globulifera]
MNHPQQQQQQPNGGGVHALGLVQQLQQQQHHQHNHTNGASHTHNNHNDHSNNNDSNSNGRVDDQGSGSSSDQNQHNLTPQRRKKASRACFHCQKAHLTCDDSRPCQRCIKRDLAATCADGVRKKAKYLQDAYDAQQLAAEQSGQIGSGIDLSMEQQLLSDQDSQQRSGGGNIDGQMNDTNALFNFPMSADYGFGSEAVNLEYSIISTMLSSPTAELAPMSDLSIVENWQRGGPLEAMANLANNNQLQKALAAQNAAAAAAAGVSSAGSGAGAGTPVTSGAMSNGGIPAHHNNANTNGAANNPATGLLLPGGGGAPAVHNTANNSTFQHPSTARVSKRKFPSNTPENVYANTKQPFNYTDGFHYLLRYVRERMDKEEMMRICRAMAMFRPSFIALIMNLTPEDLIFMEKCFQRTILEFEKLISFSGTPTVVWRRTGEIALVGKEFSLLTQWGRDQLVGKKTYIYELMDNQSAVEYWEKFSTHAFENTEQTVMTTCILLSPTNRVVPCTFCFTIKRDIFDIPLAIVGNFLPILS